MNVVEADIAQLRRALEEGRLTSEELVESYLARIEAYDRNGPRLNALVVMNPEVLQEARAEGARPDYARALAGRRLRDVIDPPPAGTTVRLAR